MNVKRKTQKKERKKEKKKKERKKERKERRKEETLAIDTFLIIYSYIQYFLLYQFSKMKI